MVLAPPRGEGLIRKCLNLNVNKSTANRKPEEKKYPTVQAAKGGEYKNNVVLTLEIINKIENKKVISSNSRSDFSTRQKQAHLGERTLAKTFGQIKHDTNMKLKSKQYTLHIITRKEKRKLADGRNWFRLIRSDLSLPTHSVT